MFEKTNEDIPDVPQSINGTMMDRKLKTHTMNTPMNDDNITDWPSNV